MKICEICGKSPQQASMGRHLNSGKWRHRGPATAKTIYPNIQKVNGTYMCTSCLRTLNHSQRVKTADK